ncbi:MAG: metal-dependent hydrolase [Candidatus Thorarchaeota archaeon]
MMPHVHLLFGLIGANIFAFTGADPSYSYWFILGSILPDIDFIINMKLKKNSHRQLFTHFPLTYLLGAFLLGIFGSLHLFWLFIGCLIHTCLDVVDWELYFLAPFSKRSITIFGLNYEKIAKEGNFIDFLKNYYQEKQILIIELLVFIVWILTYIFSILF